MFRSVLLSLAIGLVICTLLIAAEPATRPGSTSDIPKMDAEALRNLVGQLSDRVDALEIQLKDLQQKSLLAQGTPTPRSAGPTTQASANSWVITVTAVVSPPTNAIEQEILALQIKLTGGQKAQTDSAATFAQDRASSGIRTQSDNPSITDRISPAAGRLDATAPRNANYQRDQFQTASSANVGPGVSAAYHDDSIEARLATERDRLRDMQGSWEMRKDQMGNDYRSNKYTNQQIGQQQVVVSQLETDRSRAQQRIAALQRDLDKAHSTAIITGVTEDGQAVTTTAPQLLASIARTLNPGQKIRVDGVATRKAPSLEVVARAIVPLN